MNNNEDFDTLVKKYNDEMKKYIKAAAVINANDRANTDNPDTDFKEGAKSREVNPIDREYRQPDDPIAEQISSPQLEQSSDPQLEQTNDSQLEQTSDPQLEQTNESLTEQMNDPQPEQSDTSRSDQTNESQQPQQYTGAGYITIEATTANGAVPIKNANVTVTQKDGDKTNLIYNLSTGQDGKTPKIMLPTVSKEESLTPGVDKPYAEYNIVTVKPGYYTVENKNVPIFDTQEAYQPVNMIPLPDNYNKSDVIEIDETEQL